jgi:hypothetical protein
MSFIPFHRLFIEAHYNLNGDKNNSPQDGEAIRGNSRGDAGESMRAGGGSWRRERDESCPYGAV